MRNFLRIGKILSYHGVKSSILYTPIVLRRLNSTTPKARINPAIPSLKEFLKQSQIKEHPDLQPTTDVEAGDESLDAVINRPLKFFIETYGCQMNVSDSEVIRSVLFKKGYKECEKIEEADIILTNTCAVRDNAESKVHNRLSVFQSLRKKNHISPRRYLKGKVQIEDQLKAYLSLNSIYPIVGVLGCMAERMKEKLLLEDSVDFICGPDAYRDIPRLLENIITQGEKQSNIALSFNETYSDITPVRNMKHPVSAFISIMRGCNNMCSFCIVPFTRGRERSRPLLSILKEYDELVQQGVKEITLLGQNVNGFHDTSEATINFLSQHPELSTSLQGKYKASPGFQNLYQSKKKDLPGIRFAQLLSLLAQKNPEIRIRFTSPHPKDFPEEVIDVIANHHNVCSSIHLPIQSGSTSVLERMRRGYSREAYLSLVQQMKEKIPNLTLSTDVIAGFCDESEDEHQETLKVIREVEYDQAFMFAYSKREKTHAYYNYQDNITDEIKQRRLEEIIATFRQVASNKNHAVEHGKYQVVLVEEEATKSTKENITLTGRTDGNKRVVFPGNDIPSFTFEDLKALYLKYQQDEQHQSDSTNSMKSMNDPLDLSELLFGDIDRWSPELREQLLIKGYPSLHKFPSEMNLIPRDKLIGEYVLVKILKALGVIRAVPVAKTTLVDMAKFSEFLNSFEK